METNFRLVLRFPHSKQPKASVYSGGPQEEKLSKERQFTNIINLNTFNYE